jgi:Cu(I)/Ag(I) efflux system membrane protein CusA/SilA
VRHPNHVAHRHGVRIAVPTVGGIFTWFVLDPVVYPAIYEIWKWHFEKGLGGPPE